MADSLVLFIGLSLLDWDLQSQTGLQENPYIETVLKILLYRNGIKNIIHNHWLNTVINEIKTILINLFKYL